CRFYSGRLRRRNSKSPTSSQAVDANPVFDPVEHSVRLKLNLSDSLPYVVHRIKFQGLHKFNDRFVRRRIPLREGHPLDEHALEAGLSKLARTGYFKPIRKESIFGTRGSLAFSVLDNVIRPRFTHGVQGPFLNSRSVGINVPWTYALTNSDSVGVNYTLSRTTADQIFGPTSGTTAVPPVDL